MSGKIFDYIKENYTHPFSLVGGFILLWIAILAFDSFLSQLIVPIDQRTYVYLFFNLTWILTWLFLRYNYPKNKKGFLGIVIAIRTENNKQKIRLKNDFVRQLKDLIKSNELQELIHIIYLPQAHSNRLINVINNAKNQPKKWLKLRNRIKAHLYIHGDIKERKDKENKYFIDVNSTVIHIPLDSVKKAKMSKGIDQVWIRKYVFKENIEFTGFQLTAKLTFVGVRYIIGLAAFLSGDPFLALKLHENLYNEFGSSFKKVPPVIKQALKLAISEECQVISRYHYEWLKDYPMSRKYLDKSFKYSKVNYGGLLQRSILEYLHENNPKKALVTINRAKSYSKNDGTWKYNKAFLLFTLERFEEGYVLYESIANNSFPNEIDIINQTINFNNSLLETNPIHYQSNFIIGYLLLEKLNNAPEALGFFEKFMNQTKGIDKYTFLIQKGEKHISIIKEILDIT